MRLICVQFSYSFSISLYYSRGCRGANPEAGEYVTGHLHTALAQRPRWQISFPQLLCMYYTASAQFIHPATLTQFTPQEYHHHSFMLQAPQDGFIHQLGQGEFSVFCIYCIPSFRSVLKEVQVPVHYFLCQEDFDFCIWKEFTLTCYCFVFDDFDLILSCKMRP